MTSITDICNAALSHVGTRSKITSIDDDMPEASACRTHLGLVRDATLRAFDWNFARLTAALEELPDPPGSPKISRWSYKYSLPADCLRLRRLQPDTFHELAGAAVLTDARPASAVYTARIEDPTQWDAGFVDAVTFGLAARICFELTGKDDRMRTLTQLWQGALNQAAAQAANEGSSLARPWLPESLLARGWEAA